MANVYAMSAILGTEKVMQAAQSTFISSTNWTDRVGPAAALATLKKYQETQADKHIMDVGEQTKSIWRDAAGKIGLSIDVTGLPSLVAFAFNSEKSQELNTRFVIEMLRRGFLGFRQFKPSLAHGKSELAEYALAVHEVFQLLKDSSNDEIISSRVAHTGFYRLTKE